MRRVLFRCRRFELWSYPAMLYLGLIAGVAAGNIVAHAVGADPLKVFVATLILIGPAIVGARLLYVAAHWAEYRRQPARIWDRSDGGMSMFGGLPIMLLLSVPLLRAMSVPFGQFWDAGVITAMAGLAVTKVGCLLNGCCMGRPHTGWIGIPMRDNRGSVRERIPVQMIESVWAALLVIGGITVADRRPFDGALFLAVCAAYSAARMGVERLRDNRSAARGGWIGSAFSTATVAVAVAILVSRWPR